MAKITIACLNDSQTLNCVAIIFFVSILSFVLQTTIDWSTAIQKGVLSDLSIEFFSDGLHHPNEWKTRISRMNENLPVTKNTQFINRLNAYPKKIQINNQTKSNDRIDSSMCIAKHIYIFLWVKICPHTVISFFSFLLHYVTRLTTESPNII